jgi:HSP20 family protein
MTLVRWEPVRELSSLQGEMNRLFNAFFDTPMPGGSGGSRRWVPAMDLVETEDHFVLRADLPGMSHDDLSIELEGDVLTISGERKTEQEDRQEGYVRVERSFGRFSRSLTLPEGVAADGIQAEFRDGVLEVRVPKPEQRKPHRVQIGVNRGNGTAGAIEGTETPAG